MIGWTAEHCSLAFTFLIVQFLGLSFAILKMIPNLHLQILGFVIFSLYRGFFYCAGFTLIVKLYALLPPPQTQIPSF